MDSPGTAKDPTYKYSSLRYVDAFANNLLFRGPSPCLQPDGEPMFYDYDGLTAALQRALPHNFALPDNYMLMDLCLMYDDDPAVSVIEEFFQRNQNFGSVVRVSHVDGAGTCYFTTPEPDRQYYLDTFDEWLKDRLIATVEMVRGWLESSPFPVPVIVYVHCDGGCDRTAEIIGGYMLRYMGTTWAELSDIRPCEWVGGDPRPLGCNNYRALQWYAVWLNQRGWSIGDIGINDAGCVDPDPDHPDKLKRHWPCPGAQNCF